MFGERFDDYEPFGDQYESLSDEYSNIGISSQFYPENSFYNTKNKMDDDLNESCDDSHYFINKNENNIKSNNELTAPTSPDTMKNTDNKEQNKIIIFQRYLS